MMESFSGKGRASNELRKEGPSANKPIFPQVDQIQIAGIGIELDISENTEQAHGFRLRALHRVRIFALRMSRNRKEIVRRQVAARAANDTLRNRTKGPVFHPLDRWKSLRKTTSA